MPIQPMQSDLNVLGLAPLYLKIENLKESESREHLSRFRDLLQKGTPEEVHKYVESLQRGILK